MSAAALLDPDAAVAEHTVRMQAAAAALRFESASRIKSYIDQLSQLGKGPYRHIRALKDFNFLSLQRGPWQKTAKAFLITPAGIEEIAGMICEPQHPGELLNLALQVVAEHATSPPDPEQIGIVSHHLFSAKGTGGVSLPLAAIDEKVVAKAFREIQKQKPQEESPDEGIVKELQAM